MQRGVTSIGPLDKTLLCRSVVINITIRSCTFVLSVMWIDVNLFLHLQPFYKIRLLVILIWSFLLAH